MTKLMVKPNPVVPDSKVNEVTDEQKESDFITIGLAVTATILMLAFIFWFMKKMLRHRYRRASL